MGKALAVIIGTAVSSIALAGVAGVLTLLQRRKRSSLELPSITLSSRSLLRHSSLLWYQELPVYILKNSTGCMVEFSPVGASITKLIVPDKKGKKADVVLSYDCPSQLVVSARQHTPGPAS